MNSLILAEHDGLELKPECLKVIQAAANLDQPLDVLVTGHQCAPVARQLSTLKPVSRIMLADNKMLLHQPETLISRIIVQLADCYSHILCSSSAFGNSVLARVAANLNVAAISNVCSILDSDIFDRSIHAGKFLQTIQSHDRVKIISLMTSAFNDFDSGLFQKEIDAPITYISSLPLVNSEEPELISMKKSESQRPNLQSAKVVIGAGRGLNSIENLQLAESLADHMGAAIGATRAVVETGWMSNEYQIGQTAKKIAPQLYIALGVSGAIQHLAGIQDSRVIVAINKDPEAPIFKIANYAMVGDLNEILPELLTHLTTLQ